MPRLSTGICPKEKSGKFFKKSVDKRVTQEYSKEVVRNDTKSKAMENCVRVARQTLTLFVRVRILLLQPWNSSSKQNAVAVFLSGCSAVGSAPRSGRGSRGFKSRHSDQNRLLIERSAGGLFYLFPISKKQPSDHHGLRAFALLLNFSVSYTLSFSGSC